MAANIEIFTNGSWQLAATFSPYPATKAQGINGGGQFQYDIDYAVEHMTNGPLYQVSCPLPVNFDLYTSDTWPAFLLDLLPAGIGRDVWLKRLSLKNNNSADWPLLLNGAANPPGNLRIAQAVTSCNLSHPGFDKEDIYQRHEDFIEYAQSQGAAIDGASDVQGVAPKFLVVQDIKGKWHPDTTGYPEQDIHKFWLVKFARGRKEEDRTILRNEAPYYAVAKHFGLRVGEPLEYANGALFIPRFDRRCTEGSVERYGFESLVSAAGISQYAARVPHTIFCQTLARYTTDPRTEILEYIKRDVLNVALRNTDNHGRNSGLLKYPDGQILLSPLFDFAPMFLDPEGIQRAITWEVNQEPSRGRPNWGKIAKDLGRDPLVRKYLDTNTLLETLVGLENDVRRLPEVMQKCNVDSELIERLTSRIKEIADELLTLNS